MADFAVSICKIGSVVKHPDADRLDIAKVYDYDCVVPRDTYKPGDLVAYIPEQSIVPDEILQEMGGLKLSGSKHNRVKAARLRGVLSQGLVYSGKLLDGRDWQEGDDCSDALGITKYEPPIPQQFKGALERFRDSAESGSKLLNYDIENIKKYPERIKAGEHCIMSEKVHGTLCYVVVDRVNNTLSVTSKGRAKNQLVFSADVDNVYTRTCNGYRDELFALADAVCADKQKPIHILAEVFGSEVQDLDYGKELDMIVFDVLLADDDKFVPQEEIQNVLLNSRLGAAPVVYEGPFTAAALADATDGDSIMPGAGHLREGVVIRPQPEREDYNGRVILKSVSEDYLCRKPKKGGQLTEHN